MILLKIIIMIEYICPVCKYTIKKDVNYAPYNCKLCQEDGIKIVMIRSFEKLKEE